MESADERLKRRAGAITRKMSLHDDHEAFGRTLWTTIDGLEFAEAWHRRVSGTFGEIPMWYISREDLITNKLATARDKDLLDVRRLRSLP